ncbi:MAG: tetratricopeptide repeat protein [Phyllobacteriaceae bacterium]|nr:tetratricopeptide repeat protein [Phyllobacteriaceae bacterium]
MKPTVFALAIAASLAFAGTSFAAGDSSSGSDEAPEPTATTTKCKKTEVFDEKLKKCVELKKSGMNDGFSDDELYDAARELAYFDRPDDAITLLKQMADQNQPRVQNYLGFAHRKAGRMDAAMMHYQAALQLDPDYVLARSYMGQGLLKSGNVGAARTQLAQIRMRAGTDNYPYRMLSDALAGKPVGY